MQFAGPAAAGSGWVGEWVGKEGLGGGWKVEGGWGAHREVCSGKQKVLAHS